MGIGARLVTSGTAPNVLRGCLAIGPGTSTDLTIQGQLHIFGTLRCACADDPRPRGFHLRAESIRVHGHDALFECVLNASSLASADHRIELTGHRTFGSKDPDTPMDYKSIVVTDGATLRLVGHPGKAGTYPMTKIARTAPAGATSITLRQHTPGWAVGDEVVVATTRLQAQPMLFPYATFDQLQNKYNDDVGTEAAPKSSFTEQNERRIITAVTHSLVSASTIVEFKEPLLFSHYGGNPQLYPSGPMSRTHVVDEAAHVINLNRNLKVYGSLPPGPPPAVQRDTCNWECYLDRYPGLELKTRLKARANAEKTGRPVDCACKPLPPTTLQQTLMNELKWTDGIGGHIMATGCQQGKCSSMFIDAVEIFRMGQMGKFGRYANR